ncbi:hypothetical protein C1147_17385 [Clostridium botulinum]|nr:hypothetical protein C1147_17385 [Clostridium botulinum]RFM20211.1 hypothetical protein C1145_11210 [Clostridium botulinum]
MESILELLSKMNCLINVLFIFTELKLNPHIKSSNSCCFLYHITLLFFHHTLNFHKSCYCTSFIFI